MELKYSQLIENSAAFKELKRDIESGRVSHAYVFVSPDFFALDILAKLFIAQIYGGANTPIGERVFDGSLLDILELPRQKSDKPTTKLDVEDVNFMVDTSFMTSTELSHKYYIIKPSEPIGELAQNKMLKTLEEPPVAARFIIFSRGADLLPTVISRARVIKLEQFPLFEIERQLKKYYSDESKISLATAGCRGQIGLAEKMFSDQSYKKMYEAAFTTLKYMQRSPQILHYASRVIADKAYLNQYIDYIEIILRDVICLNSGNTLSLNLKNASFDIASIASDFSTEMILKIMPFLSRARKRVAAYCNMNSIVDELLFSILEVKAKCRK